MRPRIRILRGTEIALGPGKTELLDAVEATGTIAGAARNLGMSYMRAWTLIRTMNGCFKSPLVELRRGGASRGTASLTETGRAALRLYRQIEDASLRASARDWPALRKLLKD